MGLLITINSKGFDEEIYDSGYDGFTKFRIELAKSYNEEFGELYERWIYCCNTGEDFENRIFGKVIDQEGDNLICEFDSANYDFKQENVIKQLKDKLNIATNALKQIGEIENEWLPLKKLDNLDLHPVKEFIQEVECGGFIDYDGWGMPVIKTLSGKFLYKNESIYPSEVLKGKKLDCDYVALFNK